MLCLYSWHVTEILHGIQLKTQTVNCINSNNLCGSASNREHRCFPVPSHRLQLSESNVTIFIPLMPTAHAHTGGPDRTLPYSVHPPAVIWDPYMDRLVLSLTLLFNQTTTAYTLMALKIKIYILNRTTRNRNFSQCPWKSLKATLAATSELTPKSWFPTTTGLEGTKASWRFGWLQSWSTESLRWSLDCFLMPDNKEILKI